MTQTAPKQIRHCATKAVRKQPETDKITRYRSEAKEIEEAKRAMERLNRSIEFDPGRLHYVIDTRLL